MMNVLVLWGHSPERDQFMEKLRDADCLFLRDDTAEVPDFVVVSLSGCTKLQALRAGFWAGYGVPVVAIGKGFDRKAIGSRYGMMVVESVERFRQMFAAGHLYFRRRPRHGAADGLQTAVEILGDAR